MNERLTSVDTTDRFAAARAVADAVLYEGYVLYPYRASSRKNQVRFQFGVLTPRPFSEADGSERWTVRTECLVEVGERACTALSVRIRCLQAQHRSVEARSVGEGQPGSGLGFDSVDTLEVDGQVFVEWDEAFDRVIDVLPIDVATLESIGYEQTFVLPAGVEVEEIRSRDGAIAGRIVRRREAIGGRVRIGASDCGQFGGPRLVKVTVTVENTTAWNGAAVHRDEVIGHCLIAVHTMLAVDGGKFISLLDPPDQHRDAVASCRSDGAFPVLIGGEDVMLSSPIILYDHPEVAPESPGDLYDSTEIDEILALRVLTLTDAEKSEARGTDPRAAAIIDRCDEMTPAAWERLHGEVRPVLARSGTSPTGTSASGGIADEAAVDAAPFEAVTWWDPAVDAAVDPWSDSLLLGGVEVKKGSAVRLSPSHRSDAQDFFLSGLRATVAGVFRDVDGTKQVAVTVDDDPATEELAWQGRYLFFHPDEVEPIEDGPR